jgi:predicted nucleic acid-binding protein
LRLVFLDTSALVKLFVQESGSAVRIRAARGAFGDMLALLDLTRLEVHSAIHRRERKGDGPAGTTRRAREVLEQCLRSRFVVQRVTDPVLERALLLVESHALRAYDALQLAGAMEAAAGRGILDTLFVSADRELVTAAAAEGLQTLDPTSGEQPHEA